jgi:NADP-dependent 3-hydroxy acid dehydrogenase YdfG
MKKQALVIGASGGIGAAISETLHQDGYHVVMAARSEEKLEAEAAKRNIVERTIMQVDLSDPVTILGLYRSLEDAFEHPVQTIVIAAGGWIANQVTDSFEDLNTGFNTMIERNFTGPALAIFEGAKYLKKFGGGRLINISSHAATKQLPGNLAYGPSKAAIRQFALSLDNEIGPEVDITDIQPAVVNTDSMTKQLGDQADKAISPSAIGKLVVSLANLDRNTKVREISLDAEYQF